MSSHAVTDGVHKGKLTAHTHTHTLHKCHTLQRMARAQACAVQLDGIAGEYVAIVMIRANSKIFS